MTHEPTRRTSKSVARPVTSESHSAKRASSRRLTGGAPGEELVHQSSQIPAPSGLKKRRFLQRRKMRKFLTRYARYSSISDAADYAGVTARMVYKWQRNHPWFAARMLRAKVEAVDRVRGAGFRRAIDKMDTTAIFRILAANDP